MVQNNEKSRSDKYKVYVTVTAEFNADGFVRPRTLIWEDGETFEIDRVLQVQQSAARKVGGQGDRYTIEVQGQKTYLYFERGASLSGNNLGRWFVERRTA